MNQTSSERIAIELSLKVLARIRALRTFHIRTRHNRTQIDWEYGRLKRKQWRSLSEKPLNWSTTMPLPLTSSSTTAVRHCWPRAWKSSSRPPASFLPRWNHPQRKKLPPMHSQRWRHEDHSRHPPEGWRTAPWPLPQDRQPIDHSQRSRQHIQSRHQCHRCQGEAGIHREGEGEEDPTARSQSRKESGVVFHSLRDDIRHPLSFCRKSGREKPFWFLPAPSARLESRPSLVGCAARSQVPPPCILSPIAHEARLIVPSQRHSLQRGIAPREVPPTALREKQIT
jgi:hypothetical protein